jgi:hypothetical protein
MLHITVKLEINGLKKYAKDITTSSTPFVLKTLKQWAFIYRSFAQRRFDRYSKGGGNWPPLKPATIAARKGKGVGVAILRDTGQLFHALQPEFAGVGAGAVEIISALSVTVGYGGSAGHIPGGVSISDIATFHQFGMGHNPKRVIIVEPDDKTLDKMTQVAEKNYAAAAKKTIG